MLNVQKFVVVDLINKNKYINKTLKFYYCNFQNLNLKFKNM